jgi:hypothetical protein
MPVACKVQFHKTYSTVMRVLDRVTEPEHNLIENAVNTMFSSHSDYADIQAARRTIETIAAKYSG